MYLNEELMANYFGLTVDRLLEIYDIIKTIMGIWGYHSEHADLLMIDDEIKDHKENMCAKYLYAQQVGAIKYQEQIKEKENNISRTLH